MGNEWLRRFTPPGGGPRPAADAIRLICFPHAGGAASSYLSLATALTPAVDVLAVQYPGRQDRRREAPIEDIGRMAEALADEMRGQTEKPYAFFGHSMGAVLAYETACRLDERHLRGPAALILSGRGAPAPRPRLHDQLRTDADILAAVRRLGGASPQVLDDPEMREMVMPALRADYRAIGSYAWQPREPLDTPITVLIGDSDPVVTVEQAAAWVDFTTATTRTHVFPGGHFYLDSHLPRVAATLTAALSRFAPAAATFPGK
ncbi:thioesterase II family protein [Streptomyces xanthochromogenes]|uniref:thioesterase II family protein n=1 Tax=Streptomyces xanthochromogenes TaxID=67384 RepID=UPI0037FFD051